MVIDSYLAIKVDLIDSIICPGRLFVICTALKSAYAAPRVAWLFRAVSKSAVSRLLPVARISAKFKNLWLGVCRTQKISAANPPGSVQATLRCRSIAVLLTLLLMISCPRTGKFSLRNSKPDKLLVVLVRYYSTDFGPQNTFYRVRFLSPDRIGLPGSRDFGTPYEEGATGGISAPLEEGASPGDPYTAPSRSTHWVRVSSPSRCSR